MYSVSDTIAAPATPVTKSPLTLIRVSGDGCWNLLKKRFVPRSGEPKAWRASLGEWVDDQGEIDEVIVTAFQDGASYTGQEMFEISCHGNPVFVDAIMQSLYRQGVRLAKPGEFTARAVLSGKMTLFEAERVQALIEAKTRYHAELIRKQEKSPLIPHMKSIVDQVLKVQAHIEASIDYGEEDIDALEIDSLIAKLKNIDGEMRRIRKSSVFPHKMREGLKVLLTGETNVGKSSLFNALCDHQRAIVTDVHGTTRDLVHEEVDIEGMPVVFIDSAGVRETDDHVEKIGIKRIKDILLEMDLVLFLTPFNDPKSIYSELRDVQSEKLLIVYTKSDLGLSLENVEDKCVVSVKDEESVLMLKKEIVNRLKQDFGSQYLVTQRQENVFSEALRFLEEAIDMLVQGYGEEISSSHLNSFRRKIGELTGETTVEDILDHMFSDFCLGK